MGRPSKEKESLEVERLRILHEEQAKLRKRLNKQARIRKAGNHLPGEDHFKKNLAIFIKVSTPGVSFLEIGNRIGETKSVVKGWFREDPEVKEQYEWVLSHFKEAGLKYLQTLQFEAIETFALLMRHGSEKYMFEAASQILDRVGLPKVSRQEIESEETKSHKWSDREEMVSEIRTLPPEEQEQAIEMIEQLEQLLTNTGQAPVSVPESDEPESDEEEFDGNS